jgi:centrosomal protein CEP350
VINDALEVFWQCRRYGEPLEAVLPPQSFFLPHELLDGYENTSHRVFKRMIFDLVGEIFQEIYQEDDQSVEPSNTWRDNGTGARTTRVFSVGSEQIPTTIDGVRPIIHSHVTRCLGLSNHTRTAIKSNKWLLGRKTTSTVIDHMLVEDLAREEKGWIDYDADVKTRKLEIADFLFEALLYDTVYAVVNVERLRHQECLTESSAS